MMPGTTPSPLLVRPPIVRICALVQICALMRGFESPIFVH